MKNNNFCKFEKITKNIIIHNYKILKCKNKIFINNNFNKN
jgi:hypothetical protein